jgi:tetratricopeptide (TPR) repeat protein
MKNYMKYTVYWLSIFSMLIGALVFTNCEDQVLNKAPRSSYSDVAVWTDPALIKMFVVSIYNGQESFSMGNLGYNNWVGMRSLPGIGCGEAFDHQGDLNTFPMVMGTVTPDYMESSKSCWGMTWWSKYKYIRKCNLFLSKIQDVSSMDEDEKNDMIGEVRFLRAKFYFDLIKYWGGVPLIEEAFELDDDFIVPRTPYETIVDWIVKECNEAQALLPEVRIASEWGRSHQGACLALKARTLLYANSKLHSPSATPNGPLYSYSKNTWQEVANTCKDLMDMPYYSLKEVNSYQDYHQIFIEPNTEMIWVKPHSSEYYYDAGWRLELSHSSPGFGGWGMNVPTHNAVQKFQMANGENIDDPDSGYDPSPENIYKNRELRFYANFLFQGADYKSRQMEYHLPGGADSKDCTQPWNSSPTGYNLRKHIDENIDIDTEINSTPWIVFRLSEIYLTYAEAEYMLGNETKALEYLNKIRARVHLPEVNSSGEQLFKDIQHEREVELIFEHHRFFDVRRWMIAGQTEKINLTGLEWRKVDDSGNLSSDGQLEYTLVTNMERDFPDRLYYLPVPASEIQKSGGLLEQNAGY